MTERIIKLNVGGYRFCTTSSTLTKLPDTFFTAMLNGILPTTKDEEGSYFIDRDGQFFCSSSNLVANKRDFYPKYHD